MAGLRIALVVSAALLLSGSVAVAQSGNPCAEDIKKHCAGIQPGAGRIAACLKPQLASLSENCEARVLGVGVNGKLCKPDVEKLCSGIKAGTGGIRNCIKSHMAEVSDACKTAMAETGAGKKLVGGAN
jgi:hypothetical protein